MSRIKLENVSVEIPLRGFTRPTGESHRLAKNARGETIVSALNNISFEAVPGDRIGILGANGSGKSTLLRTLAGIIPPSHGSISRAGKVHAIFDPSDGVRFALSGRQNAQLRFHLLGEPGGEEESFVQQVEEFAELGEFYDVPVSTYSPGMLSRLLFAMSTVNHSDILLMDEWIGMADETFQKKVSGRIDELIMKNDIFVLASHNRDIIKRTTQRVILLDEGRIARTAPSDKIPTLPA